MIRTCYDKIIWIIKKFYWVIFAAGCIALAMYCFYHLDVKYVDSWDEARHGVNAYEMTQNHNYIQHTYNYEVDDWNLKPSMSYWGILLGFGIFGFNVFGLRFYSALCYLLTGVVTGIFVGKKSRPGGLLVLGFFCANTLPLYAHLARAGDADSLYLMLFTFAMLAMMKISENRKYLFVCGLCFSLAFLTKSWHAGMIAAIGGLYLIFSGEIRRIRGREWGFFALSVFAPLLLWFGWRYTADGFDFLRRMVETDLLARTGTSNFEGHAGPFSFYWDQVIGNTAYVYPWVFGICAAAAAFSLILFLTKRKKLWDKREELALILWFVVPFLGFSLMKTKLIWYCYPAIIPLFVGAALVLGRILEWVPEKRKELAAAGQTAAAAACAVLVIWFMHSAYITAIQPVSGDKFQDFLQLSADRDSAYAGADAYIEVPGEKEEQLGDWDQNRLFLAEISGNFHCLDGGAEAFIKAPAGSTLYIDREHYAAWEAQLAGCRVLYLQDGYPYVLLEK